MRPLLQALLLMAAGAAGAADEPFTVPVNSGPFELRVVESARLDAGRSVTIASELPSNEAKVLWLVDEGSFVEPGEAVARFDPAPFADKAAQLERELAEARAAQVQAEAELQLQLQQSEEQRNQLAHQVALAELHLRSLVDGDGPLRVTAAKAELAAARRELADARRERETQAQMIAEGLGSPGLLEQAEAAEREQASAVALAEQRLAALQSVQLPAEQREAELELARRRQQLDNDKTASQYIQARQYAQVERMGYTVANLEQSLAAARGLLEKTEVTAPVGGFVVYTVVSVGSERRKLQVGDSVWNRQGFMVIPDMTTVIAELQVREQDVGKLAVDQPVTLWPDAFADLELAGHVDFVGTLATGAAGREDNLFQVRVRLDTTDPRLRPGMRARASVLAGRFDAVLRVPVEAVFFDQGEAVCYVWSGGRAERRVVRVGPSDGQQVIVEAGLAAGDRVLLTDPAVALARNRT